MKLKYKLLYSCICICSFACKSPETKTETVEKTSPKSGLIKYAKRFLIEEKQGYKLVHLLGNKKSKEITRSFILYNDSISATIEPEAIRIKTPCKKIAALSSIYARMFYELGALTNVSAIDNIDYISCEAIREKHKMALLQEISKGIELNIEQTVVLQPDIIFAFGMGDWEKDRNRKLEKTKIPMAISLDHLEESPLARAEWLKFFAVFVNKSTLADSIFNEVEKKYMAYCKEAEKSKIRPSVFNEIKYSDSWYMPGGKSYIAHLLNDAGANYIWKENEEVGSLPLSFEQVYAKAKDADFWINLSTVKSKKELLAFEKRYSEFKAFQLGNLYNNNLHTNTNGYSDYWESAMIFPDRILSDLVSIFHPELQSEKPQQFYYYQKIQ